MNKILSMAALALIMAGCSNDNDNVKIDNGEAANAVAIQISQKVAGVESKAAITPGSTMQAVIMMVDAGSGDANNPDFSAFVPRTTNTLTDKAGGSAGEKELKDDAARATVATTEFAAKTSAEAISLNPTLYYPVTQDKKTWILGVSPQGVVDQTKVNFNDVDGLQDVMYAAQQGGVASSSSTPIELTFNHKTTQLLFVAKLKSSDLSGTEWDKKAVSVKSIIIPKAQVPNAITISNGELECTEKSLTVKGCDEALTTSVCAKSVPVMIKDAAQLVVNLVLTVGGETVTYNNLTVQNGESGGVGNLVTKPGKSHLITFEITAPVGSSQPKIGATAKIVDWEKGDAGKVEIK